MIISLTIFLFNQYTNNISPKLIKLTKFNLDKFTNKAILSKFDKNLINDYDINKLIKLEKNREGEIVNIDYDLETTYSLLGKWLDEISVNIFELSTINIEYYDDDFSTASNSFVVSYPIGLASNNMFLNNFGPRIPLRINLLSNATTTIKTRVSTYGINALLIEMYIIIDLKHEIVASSVEEFAFQYEILIASKIIQGKIPNYYGGTIERNSSVVS